MDVKISTVGSEDTQAINQVVELSRVFTDECLLYRSLGFNQDKCKDFVSKFTIVGTSLLLAHVDGVPAGYSAVVADDMLTDKPRLEMVTFYVHPDFRNTGVGAALADKVVELIELNGNGYSQLSICAYFENDRELIQRATELLFKRRGFKQVGVILGRMGE